MKNLLNLRREPRPEIKIVEKVIVKKSSWHIQTIKLLVVVGIASSVVWGISKADNEGLLSIFGGTAAEEENSIKEPIGIYGTVGTTTDNTLILTDAQGQEVTGHDTFTVDLSKVEKIQNNNYEALSFADIWIGDKMIAHGILDGTLLHADSLIVFMSRAPKATTTATTTEKTATTTDETATTTQKTATSTSSGQATTTDETATSTDSTGGEQATTTPEVGTTTPDLGTTTPPVIPSSDETASSTNATTTEPVATSTEQVTPPPSDTGTSTNPTPPMQPEETASTTPAS